MKYAIGETAGKIWDMLKASGEMNITAVIKKAGVESSLAYQALGWLAREDKIEYKMEKGKTFIRLSS